jgi:hypothetical protein
MKHISWTVLFCLFTVSLIAQDERPELVTDRPDQTESSVVVPRKSLQIETGISLTNDEAEGAESRTISLASTLLRYGLFENTELRVGVNYDLLRVSQAIGDTSLQGFTPVDIGTKVYISEEDGFLPELALIASLTMPYGSEEFRSKYMAPTLLLVASHTISDNLGFGYNIGAWWDGENPQAQGKYSAALGWVPGDKLGMFAEIFGTFNSNSGAHAVDAGITYLLAPNFQLDLSAGLALNSDADDVFISAGFSWRIPN